MDAPAFGGPLHAPSSEGAEIHALEVVGFGRAGQDELQLFQHHLQNKSLDMRQIPSNKLIRSPAWARDNCGNSAKWFHYLNLFGSSNIETIDARN